MTGFWKVAQSGSGLALAVCLSLAGGSAAFAQAAGPGVCFQPPALLNAADVSGFLGSPSKLLSDYPQGGLQMSTRARALAGSDISTVDALISLAAGATPAQKSAIGAGLARAAKACVAANPVYAAQIQQKVAASNQSEIATAFQAASSDVQTAALGGAAGGAAGGASGISGGGVAGPGSGGATGDNSTATTTPAGFTGSGGSRFFRTSTTQTTTTQSVSP